MFFLVVVVSRLYIPNFDEHVRCSNYISVHQLFKTIYTVDTAKVFLWLYNVLKISPNVNILLFSSQQMLSELAL